MGAGKPFGGGEGLERRIAHWKNHAHHWMILHGRYICKARKPAAQSARWTISADSKTRPRPEAGSAPADHPGDTGRCRHPAPQFGRARLDMGDDMATGGRIKKQIEHTIAGDILPNAYPPLAAYPGRYAQKLGHLGRPQPH